MIEQAPDINPGYPSAGERLGPAWASLWRHLGDGCWHRTKALTGLSADLGIAPSTVSNLVRQAAAKGLLEVRKVTVEGAPRPVCEYRRLS